MFNAILLNKNDDGAQRARLIGVDSVMAPVEKRRAAWARLAADLKLEMLEQITQEIGLADVLSKAHDIIAGKIRGRLVVNVNA